MMMQNYDKIIKSIVPIPHEINILQAVKAGLESDRQRSPFDNYRWVTDFKAKNEDGIPFHKAPKGELLMVVSENLRTLYDWNNRGTFIMRGSVIVRVDDGVVYCADAFSWYGGHSQAMVHPIQGIHTIDARNIEGKLKLLRDIKL